MDTDFQIQAPHEEAAALIKGKAIVTANVFRKMLPELRARAFTVSGIEGANTLQRIRDSVASIAEGTSWDAAKKKIVSELDPYLDAAAPARAELVLRTNGFQAFSAANARVAQEDEDTTHLQYLHGACKVPTPSHLALNGIVLPKDDPFWKTHTGPWGHLGCVCYTRPMNQDLVADEKSKDENKNPEDKNIIEGAARKQLNNGTIIRNGQRFDVLPPEGPGAFKWHPDDLRIPIGELKTRYDPEIWNQFVTRAKSTFIFPETTLWNWLMSKPRPFDKIKPRSLRDFYGASPFPNPTIPELPVSGEGVPRMETSDAMAELKRGAEIKSESGQTIRFAKIAHSHFEKTLQENPNDPRARFLPAAKKAVQNPIQVWRKNNRHYYIARFKRNRPGKSGFVVVAARIGEQADEAITFFPKTENELKKFQTGELIYEKK